MRPVEPTRTTPTCAPGKTSSSSRRTPAIVQRRNQILDCSRAAGRPLSRDQYSPQQLEAAKNDPVVLAPQSTPRWIAPHFVWAVQSRARRQALRPGRPDLRPARGRRPDDHDDPRREAPEDRGEAGSQAAAIVPNAKDPAAAAKQLQIPGGYAQWMRNLRGKDVHNGAMVAIDYQTGELIAYVGSAELLRDEGHAAVPAKVRRRRQRLPPAGIGVQALQLPDRDRRRDPDGGDVAHGHLDRLRRQVHARRRRQSRAGPGPRPERRSSSR